MSRSRSIPAICSADHSQRSLQQNSATGTRGIRVSATRGPGGAERNGRGCGRRRASHGDCHRQRPEGVASVVNAMNVAAPQQVMLEVRFLEVAEDGWPRIGREPLCRQWQPVTQVGNSGTGGRYRRQATPIGGKHRPRQGSLPLLGTVGTLVESAAAPFGNLLNKRAEAEQRHVGRLLVTALETKGRGAPPGRAEPDGAVGRCGALPGRR